MKEREQSASMLTRQTLLLFLLIAYIIPIGLILSLALTGVSKELFWTLVTSGIVVIYLGAAVLYMMISYWESSLSKAKVRTIEVPVSSGPVDDEMLQEKNQALDELQRKVALLHHDLFLKEEQIRHLESEKEQWKGKCEEVMRDLSGKKNSCQEEIDKLTRQLYDSKGTIGEQRAAMELHLERMNQLESKNDDLRYEIKTLLQVTQNSLKLDSEPVAADDVKEDYFPMPKPREMPPLPDRPVRTTEDAAVQLRRCLDITQKFSGSSTVTGAASRYKNAQGGGFGGVFALDMRQLFEALRQEQSAMVMFYSWNESKPLFVNPPVKSLLGWSPEAFIQNFQDIIADGVQEWRHSLTDLRTKAETLARIPLKGKTGQDVLVHCLLGRVQTGQFKNHILAVFYPAS